MACRDAASCSPVNVLKLFWSSGPFRAPVRSPRGEGSADEHPAPLAPVVDERERASQGRVPARGEGRLRLVQVDKGVWWERWVASGRRRARGRGPGWGDGVVRSLREGRGRGGGREGG
eukprot:scaffold303184_cov22-Tisochrysis_lutea.AAC.1